MHLKIRLGLTMLNTPENCGKDCPCMESLALLVPSQSQKWRKHNIAQVKHYLKGSNNLGMYSGDCTSLTFQSGEALHDYNKLETLAR